MAETILSYSALIAGPAVLIILVGIMVAYIFSPDFVSRRPKHRDKSR